MRHACGSPEGLPTGESNSWHTSLLTFVHSISCLSCLAKAHRQAVQCCVVMQCSDAGGTVDLDLAVASTLGSGLFISCVMTASVVLIRTVDIVDTTAFVRDIIAYILANLLVLLFLWNGQLAAWEAALLILLYVVYVAIACYTSRSTAPSALAEATVLPADPARA